MKYPFQWRRTLSCLLIMAILGTMSFSLEFAGDAKADSQTLSFNVSDSSHGFIASFAANVECQDEMKVTSGEKVIVPFSLSSASGSIQITIPLTELGAYIGYPMANASINVPVPETPLGSVRIPVSSYVSAALGIYLPPSVASIDLVVQSSIKGSPSAISGSSTFPLTQMEWISWGSHSALLDTGVISGVSEVRVDFGYALSYGVVASVFASDYTLVPMTSLAMVAGSQGASTMFVMEQDTSWIIAVAIVAVAAIVAILALVVWRRGRGKTRS